MELDQILSASSPALCGFLVMVVVWAVKRVPKFPSEYLPLLSIGIGAVGYPTIVGEWVGKDIVMGAVIGGFAVGAHQVFKQLPDKKNDSTSEP